MGFCVLDEDFYLLKKNRRQGRKPATGEKPALGCTDTGCVTVPRRRPSTSGGHSKEELGGERRGTLWAEERE